MQFVGPIDICLDTRPAGSTRCGLPHAQDREFFEKDLAKVQTFGVGLSYDPAVDSREYTIAVGMSEPALRLAGLGLR
ncbi:hypothetical protein AWC27_17290 [Mycobacterium szulgai]|uniref:Uncharacterized protein n=1 Tax=Mycobacterium szulgai TaxID=1787 RepID=A0A1X2FJK7_MYCSZ|nr:hypothetical protein AWC27_17290 [Mycobacterium szulgai]